MGEIKSDPRFYELRNDALFDRNRARKLILYDPSIVEARNSLGETALHYVAVENAMEAIGFLLEHGADVNTRNSFGGTPLIDAAKLGYRDMVDLLLKRGADIWAADENGETALSAAAQGYLAHQNQLITRLLLDQVAGQDINVLFDDLDLDLIYGYSHETVISLLRSHGLRDVSDED